MITCIGYVQVEDLQKMDDSDFGEGLTLLGKRSVRKKDTALFSYN